MFLHPRPAGYKAVRRAALDAARAGVRRAAGALRRSSSSLLRRSTTSWRDSSTAKCRELERPGTYRKQTSGGTRATKSRFVRRASPMRLARGADSRDHHVRGRYHRRADGQQGAGSADRSFRAAAHRQHLPDPRRRSHRASADRCTSAAAGSAEGGRGSQVRHAPRRRSRLQSRAPCGRT